MKRTDELMLDIASHFDRKCRIAHEEWLQDKDVELKEIGPLFDQCSLLLEGFAKSSPSQKARILKLIAETLSFPK